MISTSLLKDVLKILDATELDRAKEVPKYEKIAANISEEKMHKEIGYMIEANQNRTMTPFEGCIQIKRALTNLEEKKGKQTPKGTLYRFCDKPHIHITLRLKGLALETAEKAANLFAEKFYRDFSTIEAVMEEKSLSLSREQINPIIETLSEDQYCLTEESKQRTNIKDMVKLPDEKILAGQLRDIFHERMDDTREYRRDLAHFFGGKTYPSKEAEKNAFQKYFKSMHLPGLWIARAVESIDFKSSTNFGVNDLEIPRSCE